MVTRTNQHGQAVGEALGDWAAPLFPPAASFVGRTVTLEPLDLAAHGKALFAAFADAPATLWTYMSYGPLSNITDFTATLASMVDDPDWLPYAFVVDGRPRGIASYLRIQPRDGVVEVGSITLSPTIQRTTAATEALYLMFRNVFDLGYRRCEWKCDELNTASRSAAERLGFTYEGIFRQATHYKGRNRDTAWYSVIDREWPDLDEAFQRWLSPDNFASDGRQIRSLRDMREGD